LRLWKKELIDAIFDPQFFVIPPSLLVIYAAALAAVIEQEPERLLDFIGKSVTSSGPVLFLSRDQEIASRAAITKRLALALYCADSSTVLKYISSVQERVVDTLRQNSAASGQGTPVGPELFLLWRVLFGRIGGYDGIPGLMPIIITEAIVLVGAVLNVQRDRPPRDLSSSLIQLCKLLDIMRNICPTALLLYRIASF
jgi:hypothetical protein